MKFIVFCATPGLILVLLSVIFEPHTGRHAPPGPMMQLGGSLLALGSIPAFAYCVFLFSRMCWRNFMAPHRIAEELKLARLAREQGQGSTPAASEPESGRIFGRLS